MKLSTNHLDWVELLSLIILEIVSSIDNIVLITILVNKLPNNVKNYAQLTGILIALAIRIGLLSIISQITIVFYPKLFFKYSLFSGRKIILLFCGTFLLIKTIIEIYKQLINKKHKKNINVTHSKFWIIVTKIIIIDIISSLDTIVIAINTINNSLLIIIAITISTILTLLMYRTFLYFIKKYQIIAMLCLIFLLMLSIKIIAEGFDLYISKSYLYIVILLFACVRVLNKKFCMNNLYIRLLVFFTKKSNFSKKNSIKK